MGIKCVMDFSVVQFGSRIGSTVLIFVQIKYTYLKTDWIVEKFIILKSESDTYETLSTTTKWSYN